MKMTAGRRALNKVYKRIRMREQKSARAQEAAKERETVTILSVDDEGFLHDGPAGDDGTYWTRFEDVTEITALGINGQEEAI